MSRSDHIEQIIQETIILLSLIISLLSPFLPKSVSVLSLSVAPSTKYWPCLMRNRCLTALPLAFSIFSLYSFSASGLSLFKGFTRASGSRLIKKKHPVLKYSSFYNISINHMHCFVCHCTSIVLGYDTSMLVNK